MKNRSEAKGCEYLFVGSRICKFRGYCWDEGEGLGGWDAGLGRRAGGAGRMGRRDGAQGDANSNKAVEERVYGSLSHQLEMQLALKGRHFGNNAIHDSETSPERVALR